MAKSIINFTKGMVTGVVVGTTVTMVMKSISNHSDHSNKKSAARMFKNIGSTISHFNEMWK